MFTKEVFTSKRSSLAIKKRLVETYLQTVATYGRERWILNDTENKRLDAFETDAGDVRKRYMSERKTNEDVLRTVKEKRNTFVNAVRARHCKTIGQVS